MQHYQVLPNVRKRHGGFLGALWVAGPRGPLMRDATTRRITRDVSI